MRRLIFALLLCAAAGCTSTSAPKPEVAPTFAKPPSYDQLVARALLDRCPATPSVAGAAHALPDLTLPCLGAGPAVDLARLRGMPTVVNIWGTWCGPCQEETRYLAQVYAALKPTVLFLGVDTEDDPRSALDFAPHVQPPMRYPQVVDDDKRLLLALRLQSAVPTTLFVDSGGRLVHISRGPYRSADALRSDLQRYLKVGG